MTNTTQESLKIKGDRLKKALRDWRIKNNKRYFLTDFWHDHIREQCSMSYYQFNNILNGRYDVYRHDIAKIIDDYMEGYDG